MLFLRPILFIFMLFSGSITAEEAFKPYAVYLTWQSDPTTTMTVHWLAPTDDPHPILRLLANDTFVDYEASSQELPDNQLNYQLYTLEIKDLNPNTKYTFDFGEKSRSYHFLTAPRDLTEPLVFIVGGDMYHRSYEEFENNLKEAAKLNPLFAMAGGDLAYAGGRHSYDPENGVKWLEFVEAWSRVMVGENDRLIPILAAIGNHDVSGRYGQTPDQAKYYYTLFSFPGNEGCGVLDFGDYLSLLLLDSDHSHPIDGEQVKWLEKTLSERTEMLTKFALYHVPAYPSKRDFKGEVSSKIREHWVPIFDQYRLTAAFENHEHLYKRTHPLKDNQIDLSGTLYLGDGAWGVPARIPHTPEEIWYLAKTESLQHVIKVTLHPEKRIFQAINMQGEVFDQIEQTIEVRK